MYRKILLLCVIIPNEHHQSVLIFFTEALKLNGSREVCIMISEFEACVVSNDTTNAFYMI